MHIKHGSWKRLQVPKVAILCIIAYQSPLKLLIEAVLAGMVDMDNRPDRDLLTAKAIESTMSNSRCRIWFDVQGQQ